ncbi:MAG: DUF6134 family protein [Betaproteobacteria bacterium]
MNAALTCAVFLLALFPALALAGTHEVWRFRVLLDGRAIGSHVYTVDANDGRRDVHSTARFDVKFLSFDAYTYVHDAHEQWKGGCLTAIDSRTDDDGTHLAVHGVQSAGLFDVVTPDGNASLAGCVMSFAYWDPAILRAAKLLNAQTGEYVEVGVESLGEDSIQVRGHAISARRYVLRAPAYRIDLWYSADGDWVQLESVTTGGRTLRYLIQ